VDSVCLFIPAVLKGYADNVEHICAHTYVHTHTDNINTYVRVYAHTHTDNINTYVRVCADKCVCTYVFDMFCIGAVCVRVHICV